MAYLKCYICFEVLDDKQEIFTQHSEVLKFCSKCSEKVREKIDELVKEGVEDD